MKYLFILYIVGAILTLVLSLGYVYQEFKDRAYSEVFLLIFIVPLFSWFGVYKLIPMLIELWKARIDSYIKIKVIKIIKELREQGYL